MTPAIQELKAKKDAEMELRLARPECHEALRLFFSGSGRTLQRPNGHP